MAKLNAAESIRGIACLAVVFSHLSLSFYPYLHHFDTSEKPENQWVYLIHHSPCQRHSKIDPFYLTNGKVKLTPLISY